MAVVSGRVLVRRASALAVVFAAVAAAVALTGCGSDDAKKKKDPSVPVDSEGEPEAKNPDEPGVGFDLASFAYGPYLFEAPPAGAGAGDQVSLEVATLDVRRRGTVTENDFRDYRWISASVITAPEHLPKAASEGCADVSQALAKTAGSFATDVTLTGGVLGEAKAGGDGIFRLESKDAASAFDTTKATSASITGGGETLTASTPETPKTALVQLGGPYEVVLSLNMPLGAVNEAMTNSTSDLYLDDGGSGDGYDGIVVLLLGAKRAQAVRCVIPAGGSVSVPASVYQPMLPLRGLLEMHARVSVATSDGRTIWTAAAVGNGIELAPTE